MTLAEVWTVDPAVETWTDLEAGLNYSHRVPPTGAPVVPAALVFEAWEWLPDAVDVGDAVDFHVRAVIGLNDLTGITAGVAGDFDLLNATGPPTGDNPNDLFNPPGGTIPAGTIIEFTLHYAAATAGVAVVNGTVNADGGVSVSSGDATLTITDPGEVIDVIVDGGPGDSFGDIVDGGTPSIDYPDVIDGGTP